MANLGQILRQLQGERSRTERELRRLDGCCGLQTLCTASAVDI